MDSLLQAIRNAGYGYEIVFIEALHHHVIAAMTGGTGTKDLFSLENYTLSHVHAFSPDSIVTTPDMADVTSLHHIWTIF